MNTRVITFPTILSLGVVLTGLLAAVPGRAQTTDVITLKMPTLAVATTYYLDFQLVDGGLTADGNSVVTLSGFSSAGFLFDPALGQSFGAGVSGSLATGLTFTDTDPSGADEFRQAFTVLPSTSQVQFTLRLAPTSLDTPIPDTFEFGVLDSSHAPLPTNGPTGAELVSSNFSSLTPSFDPAYHTVSGAFLQPTITAPTPVPEAPVTVSLGLLLALGLGGVLGKTAERKPKAA